MRLKYLNQRSSKMIVQILNYNLGIVQLLNYNKIPEFII